MPEVYFNFNENILSLVIDENIMRLHVPNFSIHVSNLRHSSSYVCLCIYVNMYIEPRGVEFLPKPCIHVSNVYM